MTTLSPHPALAPAALALPLALGLHERIAANGLDGSLTQQGAGIEMHCRVQCRDVRHSNQPTLRVLLHLFILNRGVLLTPFHSMPLASPATTAADVQSCWTAWTHS